MTMSRRGRLILDFVLLQSGWFACVLGAADGRVWLGPAFVAVALLIHSIASPRPGRDLALGGVMLAVGWGADALQVTAGVLAFDPAAPRLGPVPLWILALWPLFAVTFHTTFAWLHRRPWLAAVVGLLGGPPGYVAADKLGALDLAEPLTVSFLSLGVTWAVALPIGLWFAARQGADEVSVAGEPAT